MTSTLKCTFAIKWEIGERKLAALKDSEDGCLSTEPFFTSNDFGVLYGFSIFPNGYDEETRGKVLILFSFDSVDGKKVKVDYGYRVDSSAKDFERMKHENKTSKFEATTLCTTAELYDPANKYIFDGKLSLKIQGTWMVESENAGNKEAKKWEEREYYGELWKRNDTKDFTIIVDGKTLKVHKNMLSVRSKVFGAMLNEEKNKGQMKITDFTFETVKTAIQLCYNRKISSLTFDEKMDVLPYFYKYKIHDLKDSAEASLIQEISLTNVCRLANRSLISNALKLQSKCMEFLVECSKKTELPSDFGILDKNFAFKVLEDTFYRLNKT